MGREKRKEGDYDTSVQGPAKRRRKGFPAMTKASRDTQARRKGKERKEKRKRERERDREREEEKKRKESGRAHTLGRGVKLSVTFRNTPKGKEGRGGG